MNKKLIITEQQYKNLKFFLLESTFDEMAKKVIKRGDTITITTQGKKFNFLVVNNTGGQILMDVNDKNSDYFGKRAFLTFASFKNNKLELNLASEKQKIEQPPQVKTWAKWILKDVEQIDVLRDGKILDGTNYDPNGDENKKRKLRFIEAISSLNEGDRLIIETTGKLEEIYLDFIGKTNGFVQFELAEETEDNLGNANISSIEISINENDIEISKEGLLTVNIITYESKEGNMEKKESKIQNIRDFSITNSKDDEENSEDEKDKEENQEEDNGPELDAQRIYDIITGDTQLRNAFYKRPSFWRSFTAELKGEKPKTTGYVVVKNLIDNYMDNAAEKRLGKNFLRKQDIRFRPLDNILIRYNKNGKDYDYRLNKNEQIENMRYIGSRPSEDSNYNIFLSNADLDILVKEKTQTQNVYVCDVIKKYTENVVDDEGNKKQVKKYSEPAKDINIEFIDSDGYRVDKGTKN